MRSYSHAMLFVRLGFEGGTVIQWRLSGAGPSSFPLHGTDWELLNPLLYQQTSPWVSAPFSEFESGQFIGDTREIVFLHKSKKKDELSKSDEASVIEVALRFLARLRHVSGQARAPQGKNLAMITVGECDALPDFTPIPTPPLGSAKISRYWFGVSVTDEHINTAVRQPTDFESDIYETLFLDAIAAHLANDFRSSVLYSAMSIEVAFGAVIDAQYAKILAGPQEDRYRVVRISTAGGNEVVKDPIFERLKRDRESFPCKIHELSLYVIGKSLMTDDQPLYTQAKSLYETRNKLVHSGIVPESANLFPLDQKGSFKALETVKKVLSWLNVDSGISLPVIEFVPIKELRV